MIQEKCTCFIVPNLKLLNGELLLNWLLLEPLLGSCELNLDAKIYCKLKTWAFKLQVTQKSCMLNLRNYQLLANY